MASFFKEDYPDRDVFQAMRVRSESDLFFFSEVCCELGISTEEGGPRLSEDQKELSEWLQRDTDKVIRIVMSPRGTLKSTVSRAHSLWYLMNKNVDGNVLYYAENHDKAKQRLAATKRLIACNTFMRVYGNVNGSVVGRIWNEKEVTFASRANMSVADPSIDTAGLDGVVTGGHYHLIACDDLHSENNTYGKDAVSYVINKFRLLLSLLHPKKGKIIVYGVYWNDYDLLCWLEEEYGSQLDIFKKPLYAKNSKVSQYPITLPDTWIERTRSFMRSDVFSLQYLLEVVSSEDTVFSRDRIAVRVQEAPTGVVFMSVDPAGDFGSSRKERRDSDFTAIVVCVFSAGKLTILDLWRGRVSVSDQEFRVIEMAKTWMPSVVGIEQTGQGSLFGSVRQACYVMGLASKVVSLAPGVRSKLSRIIALEPMVRRRDLQVLAGCPFFEELVDEMSRVTLRDIKSKHDDLMDALAYTLDLISLYAPPPVRQAVPVKDRFPSGMSDRSVGHWESIERMEGERKRNQMEEYYV